jgi:hypothetical protein
MSSLIVTIVAGATGLALASIVQFISALAELSRLTPRPIRVLSQQPARVHHLSCRIQGDLS